MWLPPKMTTIGRPSESVPLCVDLDGTLVRADTTWEMLVAYLLDSPLGIIRVVRWARKGLGHVKVELWKNCPIDVEALPYDEHIRSWIEAEGKTRQVFLVSGAAQELVDEVVRRNPVFREGIGSTRERNLTASAKADALTVRFGHGGFDYAGNSVCDIPVWRAARRAYGANVNSAVARQASSAGFDIHVISSRRSPYMGLVTALRISQWTKNLLCIVPIIASHNWASIHAWESMARVFSALCLASSAIYIGNDLRDIQNDRKHPAKRHRPLANGTLSVTLALLTAAMLTAGWIGMLSSFNGLTQALLATQLAASVFYTLRIKQVMVLDIIWLGLLYCNRIVIGAVALGLTPTAWLLGFALFFFVGIACVKRFRELSIAVLASHSSLPGRGYLSEDRGMIGQMGYSSSLMSVLVLALYIAQPEIRSLYPSPHFLWILCIILFYWVTRLWIKANRGEITDDPLDFVLRDAATYYCGGFCLALVMAGALIKS